MVIPLVVIDRKGLFKMRPRTDVIALEPASYAKDVQCPARRWQSGECRASRRDATATSRIGARSARTKLTNHMP